MVREICKVFTIAQHAASPPFFPLFFPTSPRDVGMRRSLEGSTVGSPLVILMYKSSNPDSRHTRTRNFRAGLFSPLPLPLTLSLFLPPSLRFARRYSTEEKASPGIPRAFRINKGSEARRGSYAEGVRALKKLVPRDVSERRVYERYYENLFGSG